MCAAIAPFDGAETVVAQEGIEKADRTLFLASVAQSGGERIAPRQQVFDGDRMLAINAYRNRHLRPDDVVVPGFICTLDILNVVLAHDRIE